MQKLSIEPIEVEETEEEAAVAIVTAVLLAIFNPETDIPVIRF